MTEASDDDRMAILAMAAFHLGEELGSHRREGGEEYLTDLLRELREIAEGRTTLIGSDVPRILQFSEAARLSPEAGNEAVAQEREAARLLLRAYLEAQRMWDQGGE